MVRESRVRGSAAIAARPAATARTKGKALAAVVPPKGERGDEEADGGIEERGQPRQACEVLGPSEVDERQRGVQRQHGRQVPGVARAVGQDEAGDAELEEAGREGEKLAASTSGRFARWRIRLGATRPG
ncbi:MAG: hypothetical protein LC624_10830 [Halobacteriales archaeon]|nr:hypothetical protein [Halobacteriales archaeon]